MTTPKVMIDARRGITARLCDAFNPYQWITAIRNRLFDHGVIESREFHVPTICIGNITVGGTGKTPHTEYLIELLGRKVPHSGAEPWLRTQEQRIFKG